MKKLGTSCLVVVLAATMASCDHTGGDVRSPCTDRARDAITQALHEFVPPAGAEEIGRRRHSCLETSAGHGATIAYRFDGDDSQFGSLFAEQLSMSGWKPNPLARGEMHVWSFVKSLGARTDLLMTISTQAESKLLQVSIAEMDLHSIRLRN